MWGSTNTAPQERCCKRVFRYPNLVNPRMIVILEDDYPMAISHYYNIGSDSNDYNVPLQWDAIGAVDVNLFLIPQKRYASVAMFWSSRREQLFLVGSVLIPPWIQSTQGGPQHEVTKNPIYSRGAPSNENVVFFSKTTGCIPVTVAWILMILIFDKLWYLLYMFALRSMINYSPKDC
jgi:hypothetical protein